MTEEQWFGVWLLIGVGIVVFGFLAMQAAQW
jgi:hypothetical protein